MFKNNAASFATLSLAVSAVIYGSPATAQQGAVLEEILVTAQRRTQSVMDVPIAVNAYDASQLELANVTRTEDLTLLVPGLQVANSIGNALVFMRGVGTLNAQPGAEAGVAFYVDDVYFAEGTSVATSLGNIERVEVLKGPQGTLYGRNATGGLIHVITQEPQLDPQGKVKIGYEKYDAVVGSLYATAGVSEQLKGSIDISFRDQGEGYGENLTTGNDVNRIENWKIAGKVLWEPTDADKVTLAGDYLKDTSDKGFVTTLFPGFVGLGLNTSPDNIQDTWGNETVDYENESYGGSLKWEHSFGDDLVFKSISAYREVNGDGSGFDGDADAADLSETITSKEHWSFQQEFLLQGSGDSMDYTAGLFYFTNESSFPLLTDFATPAGFLFLGNEPENETTSYSVFGQMDYELTERDILTVGLRYTIDEQKFSGVNTVNGFVTDANQAEEDFDKLTWRFAYKHNFTEQLMAYGSYSRGYRSGVFNTLSQNLSDPPVDPEVLDAYELGFKGSFADNSIELGINAFYYDYQDIQVQTLQNTVLPVLLNAGEAEIYGVEVEAMAAVPVPVGQLVLRANGSASHDEYKEFDGCPIVTSNAPFPGGSEIISDCSGNRIPWTPRFDLSVGGYYTLPVEEGELSMGVNYYYSDGYYHEPANLRKQSSYGILNAEVAYTFPDTRTRVRLYGSNLTDEDVWDFVFASPIGIYGFVRPPLSFGVEVQYAWGQ